MSTRGPGKGVKAHTLEVAVGKVSVDQTSVYQTIPTNRGKKKNHRGDGPRNINNQKPKGDYHSKDSRSNKDGSSRLNQNPQVDMSKVDHRI